MSCWIFWPKLGKIFKNSPKMATKTKTEYKFRNPHAVQPHLRKCFDAIAKLEFGMKPAEEGKWS